MGIIDMIKSKRRIKCFASQTQQGAVRYRAFTPNSDIQNGQEYMTALDWALEQDDIRNIAISGPYGSGKSSVISTYFKTREREDVLHISLAAFNLESMCDNEGEITDDALEIGILKQLFYRVRANRIPKSRYRKIQPEKWRGNILISAIVEFLVLIFLNFAFPEQVMTFAASLNTLPGGLGIALWIAVVIALWTACFAAVRWFRRSGSVQEIKILDKATLKGGDKEDNESVFNKNMDEIVYFFEETKYRIVVIEDLDRFDSSNIFVALRELNNLLNHYEGIEEKVTFIYAIKDDMFQKEGERTKFFDFIIPVVPYISSTNSGEILRERLQFDDESNSSKIYEISGKFISLISPYISDMRDLTSICNEFIVFKNTLKGNQNLNLNDTQMFSLIVFKNLYPRDFAQLEDETDESIVRQAFYDKQKLILERNVYIAAKRQEKEEIICKTEQEVFENVRDLKIALLMCVMNYSSFVRSVSDGKKTYQYTEILHDDFDIDLFKKTRLTVNYYSAINSNTGNKTIDDIEKLVTDNGEDYFERIDRVKKGLNDCKEDAKREIEEYEQAFNALRTYSIQRIIKEFGTDFMSEEVRKNDLLVFLLRNGFVDENYADYINYFHPNSISKDEMNFILGVRNHKSEMDYSYSLKNVSRIFERLQDYEFQQPETLNYDLVDYVLTRKPGSPAEQFLFSQLANHSQDSMAFIKAYVERGYNIDRFIMLLSNVNNRFWTDICDDSGISLEARFMYLGYIVSYASEEDIVAQDGEDANEKALTDFFLNHSDVLARLKDVPDDKQIQVIDGLGLVFTDLETDDLDASVKNHIFESCCYEINMAMLSRLAEWKTPELVEELKSKNYTTIRVIDYQPLTDYVQREFEVYVSSILLGLETNIHEDIDAVEDVIERLCPNSIELALSVLEKETVVWDTIEACCAVEVEDDQGYKKQIWEYLLNNDRILCAWENVDAYFRIYGDDETWVSYIARNVDDLISVAENTSIADDIRETLLFEDFLEEVYRKVATGIYKESYSDSLSKLNEMKIRVLIEEHLLPFTKTYWTELSTEAPDLRVVYALESKEEFIQDLDDITLTIDEVNQLLDNDVFGNDDKDHILKKITPAQMTEKTAMILRSTTCVAPKEYIVKAWELLSDDKKYQLLLNHMNVFQDNELAMLFGQLSSEYHQLVERTRHKYSLAYSDFNKSLLEKLNARNYVTSVEETYVDKTDKVLFSSKKEHVLTGYVKNAR